MQESETFNLFPVASLDLQKISPLMRYTINLEVINWLKLTSSFPENRCVFKSIRSAIKRDQTRANARSGRIWARKSRRTQSGNLARKTEK